MNYYSKFFLGADYFSVAQTSPTVRTITYKVGGSGGVTVGTVVVTYVDQYRQRLLTVEVTS